MAANPALWNGRVLISRNVRITNGHLTADLSETDYASFVIWRDLGWPDKSVFNIFGMGVMRCQDGALVLGEMASHTVNAGAIYPPGGSLEPRDIRDDGSVDLDGSVAHEITEETGFDVSSFRRGERHAIFDAQRIAIVQAYDTHKSFKELEKSFERYQKNQQQPELSRLVPVRNASEINAAMPEWTRLTVRLLASPQHDN